jgi:hypothetical protein
MKQAAPSKRSTSKILAKSAVPTSVSVPTVPTSVAVLTVLACLASLCFMDGNCPAQAQSPDNTSAAKASDKVKDTPITLSADGDSRDPSGNLTLSDLRDSGLSLNQIRQQAIYIFIEATRKFCNNSSKLEQLVPNTISDKDIETNASKSVYMVPRAQWLVYYVGTVEPIISLFSQDVRDTKSGATKLLVPEDAKDKMLPLWHEWQDGIDGINKELTEINNLIGDGQPENVSLAKHAVAMFKYTENLEHTRQKAFVAIRSSQKRNVEGNKVNLQ